MKLAGYFIGTLGMQAGAAALVFYLLNIAVWSVLAGLLGGGLGLIGLGLIMWALYPLRRDGQPFDADTAAEAAAEKNTLKPAAETPATAMSASAMSGAQAAAA